MFYVLYIIFHGAMIPDFRRSIKVGIRENNPLKLNLFLNDI
jgi:hypothetical protein